MVEYNKYDDLKEQQHIINLIDGVSIADQQQPQELAGSSDTKYLSMQFLFSFIHLFVL